MFNIIRAIFTFVVFFFIGFCAYSIIRPLWAHEATVEEAPLNCDEIDLGTYDYTHVSTNRPTRNNNPGNIRKTGKDYYGETSNDPAFESFAAPEWGYAAMFDLLDRLYTGLTLSEAIYKWAPPVENDTERYVKFVAKKTGYDRNEYKVNVNDPSIMNFAKYMSILEGMKGFSDADVDLGYLIWKECYNVD